MVEKNGGKNIEIRYRVNAAWGNWNECSGVLCDRKMTLKLKGEIHRIVVTATLVYGGETSTGNNEKQRKEDEMRILRWVCGVTKKDKIRNEHLRGSVNWHNWKRSGTNMQGGWKKGMC